MTPCLVDTRRVGPAILSVVGVVIGGVLTLTGQFGIEYLRRRGNLRYAARLIRDDIAGAMEAVHYTIENGEWWPPNFELETISTTDDRRLLAAHLHGPTLRGVFGAQRRFNQLRAGRRHVVGSAQPAHDEMVEVVTVFFELAIARRGLAEFVGYGTYEPFSRPLRISPAIEAEACRRAGIDSAEGLYRRRPEDDPKSLN